MNKPAPLTNRERVARRRAALRAQGLRPKQIWVPDLRIAEVREQIRREAAVLAALDRDEDIALAEAIQHWPTDGEG